MKKLRLKIFAFILVLFGIVGMTGSIAGIPIASKYLKGMNTLPEINETVVAGFSSISATVTDVSSTTKNVTKTLIETKKSLSNASLLSDQAGTAFHQISEDVNFEIFGYKPLAETSTYFKDIGDTLAELSSQILNTVDSLDVNIQDVDKLSQDFILISAKLDKVSEVSNRTLTLLPIESFLRVAYIFLIYIAVLHLMFVIIGLGMLQLSSRILP
ncbi:MAG: hypothetical protein M1308_19895 [Actinobacteria bacterium]|nr:hypothetical protein [Actinomycetota bacterium]